MKTFKTHQEAIACLLEINPKATKEDKQNLKKQGICKVNNIIICIDPSGILDEEKTPLMYKGYLIKEIHNYLHVSNPATGRELNIKFKTWPDAKEFINNLKTL